MSWNRFTTSWNRFTRERERERGKRKRDAAADKVNGLDMSVCSLALVRF